MSEGNDCVEGSVIKSVRKRPVIREQVCVCVWR